MRTKVDMAVEVNAMASLSRAELATLWTRTYGSPPAGGIRTELLVRSAAWYLQVKHLGGFTAETRRLLKIAKERVEATVTTRGGRTSDSSETSSEAGNTLPGGDLAGSAPDPLRAAGKRKRRQLKPGARLLRDWNGRTHVVDVIEGGFVFEAKIYPSLTAIARTITGAHWSGPRFFGL